MKITFFELEGWEEDMLKTVLRGHDLVFSREKIDDLSRPEQNDADIISVFVNSRITAAVLEGFPNLKLIATRSAGYDHIDLIAAKSRGVSVAYVPGYGNNTVAEFAFGLILNLTRKISRGIMQVKEAGSFALEGLRGTDICGKTMGVVGTGRIGREVIHIAKGFRMNVVAFDPSPRSELERELGFSYADLDTLLRTSDVISIHCPSLPATYHLLNENNMRNIKRGAVLINTARGPIVSTAALVSALQEGILSGAALDVLEEEGETKDELHYLENAHPKEEELKVLLENHVLMRMPNVLVTPHMAFDSQQALEQILSVTLDNIKGFLAHTPYTAVPTAQ